MIGHRASIRARRVGREWLLPLVQCCPAGSRLMVIVQSQALISGLDKDHVSLVSGGAQIVLFCSAGSFLFLLFFCLLISYLLSSWPVCAASCVFLWFVRSRSRSVGFVSMVHLVSSIRDELAYILERCNIRVMAERPGSHRQMSSFMLREGSSLLKQPDIIIPDLDGRRPFTLIDVKIFELRLGSPFLCRLVCQIRSTPPPGS